jgi:D-beta-D-heptose 7-phosphate kinase/D-beta-D-heptose 1-phosphate adenosyltransferase
MSRNGRRPAAKPATSNLNGLGVTVSVIELRGSDGAGRRQGEILWHDRLKDMSIECADRSTITKTRLVSKGQQLLRMDEEETRTAAVDTINKVIRRVEENAAEMDSIVIPDYGRGLLQSEGLSQAVVAIGRHRGITMFMVPKGRD